MAVVVVCMVSSILANLGVPEGCRGEGPIGVPEGPPSVPEGPQGVFKVEKIKCLNLCFAERNRQQTKQGGESRATLLILPWKLLVQHLDPFAIIHIPVLTLCFVDHLFPHLLFVSCALFLPLYHASLLADHGPLWHAAWQPLSAKSLAPCCKLRPILSRTKSCECRARDRASSTQPEYKLIRRRQSSKPLSLSIYIPSSCVTTGVLTSTVDIPVSFSIFMGQGLHRYQ